MNEVREPSLPSGAPEGVALPDGEERPPAGTRTAAIVRWSLVALMAAAALGTWTYHAATGGIVDLAATRYRCPMHPSIVTGQKGECPICGMDLVPATQAHVDDAHAAGAPPATAPAGADARAHPVPAIHREVASSEYTCPMHPAFTSSDPKARCPSCGMKLVPASADAGVAHAGHAAHPGEGVPGLAPVELTADRIQLTGMRTAAAAREPLGAALRTVGFVTASEKGLVSVNVRFSGWIESLGAADIGQLVEKGAVLATIYSPDALSPQLQFLATARWSERRPGAAPPAGPTAQYDAARDARQRLELLGIAPEDIDDLAASEKPANTLNVRAPIRGYVARKTALRGLYVQPGTELFQIADLSRVWVIADVYESDLRRVRVGQPAVLELPAWPGERFSGRIAFIYPAVDPASRTLQARIELPNRGLKLRPGMFGDVTLQLGASEALVVPAEALVDTGDLQYVFVSRGGGRFEPRRVRASAAGDGKVAVHEGLAEGERVVTTANFLLDSESRLRAALEGFGGGAAPRDGPR